MPKTPYFHFIKQISRVRNNHPRALRQTKNCFSAIPQAPLRTEYRSPHSKKGFPLFRQNSLRPALKEGSLLFCQNSLRPAPALPFLSKFSAACAQKNLTSFSSKFSAAGARSPFLSKFSAARAQRKLPSFSSKFSASRALSPFFRQNLSAPSDGARRPCLLGRAGILRRGCFIKNFPFP